MSISLKKFFFPDVDVNVKHWENRLLNDHNKDDALKNLRKALIARAHKINREWPFVFIPPIAIDLGALFNPYVETFPHFFMILSIAIWPPFIFKGVMTQMLWVKNKRRFEETKKIKDQ